ncbi:MAG TPA: hypothetical protein VL961_10315 [Acidimicrobiales bacterium]|nr:hypothetical protein [Acidimicrobiales bacterium]
MGDDVATGENLPGHASSSVATHDGSATVRVRQAAQERLDAIDELISSWDWRSNVATVDPPLERPAAEAAQDRSDHVEPTGAEPPKPDVGLVGTLEWPLGTTSHEPEREPPEPHAEAVTATPADGLGSPHRTRSKVRAAVWAVTALVMVAAGIFIGWKQSRPGSAPPKTPSAHATTTLSPARQTLRVDFIATAKPMYQANAAATQALDSSNGSDSVATVFRELVPYTEAMSNYEYELHFLPWTPDVLAASTALHQQLGTFVSFLHTVTSATSATLGSWLSTFQTDARATQIADNHLRSELGLPTGASYP